MLNDTRTVMISGLTVTLIIFIGVMMFAAEQVNQAKTDIRNIVDMNNKKSELIVTMHTAARERVLDLFAMISTDDPFLRDDFFLHFNKSGANFAVARMALLELPLDVEEKRLIDLQGSYTGSALPLQIEIIDLIQRDEFDKARALISEGAIETQNRVLEALGELLSYQQVSSRALRDRTDSGIDHAQDLVMFWSLIAILLGGFIALFIIRSTSRIEARLKIESERANATLKSISDGVVRLDEDGYIDFINDSAQKLLGNSQTGNNIREILPFQNLKDRHKFNTALNKFNSSSDYALGVYPLQHYGKQHWAELSLVPVMNNEKISGYVLGIVDITEIKQSELKLLDLNETLEEKVRDRTHNLEVANHTLESTIQTLQITQNQLVDSEKMASLGNLVAGISHEINTPIGIGITSATHVQERIGDLAYWFENGELKKSQLEAFISQSTAAAKILVTNLKRASELIRSFKHVAVDQSSDEWRTINLKDYCDEIILSLHPKLKRRSITINNLVNPHIRIHTNPGAIYQILSNFILNSLNHGFEEQDDGLIEIEAMNNSDETTVIYRDDGVGMPEESKKRIFEPFYTTKRGKGGSGLGMNIVYNLVKTQLKGDIDLDSNVGQGVEIRIALPV